MCPIIFCLSIQEIKATNTKNFTFFRADCKRQRRHGIVGLTDILSFRHLPQNSMISQSRESHYESKNQAICDIIGLDFLICENQYDSKDFPAPINDRKTAARPFDTINEILRSLGLAQSLLKSRNAQIWRKREPLYLTLLGTHGLIKNRCSLQSFLDNKIWPFEQSG